LYKRLLAILATLAFSSSAFATEDNNMSISGVGAQNGTYAYLQFTTPPTGSCIYNSIYIDVSTDTGRAALSVALTARVANIRLARIAYTGGGGGMCYATLLQM
jgi:hypothetical protein